MKWLRKLPGSVREAPGLEWRILKKLPHVLVAGTLVPVLVSLGCRWLPPAGSAAQVAKFTTSVDIFSAAVVVTLWTAVFTVAIGCVVVVVMKGPAYVADAYQLVDAERPAYRRAQGDRSAR